MVMINLQCVSFWILNFKFREEHFIFNYIPESDFHINSKKTDIFDRRHWIFYLTWEKPKIKGTENLQSLNPRFLFHPQICDDNDHPHHLHLSMAYFLRHL